MLEKTLLLRGELRLVLILQPRRKMCGWYLFVICSFVRFLFRLEEKGKTSSYKMRLLRLVCDRVWESLAQTMTMASLPQNRNGYWSIIVWTTSSR